MVAWEWSPAADVLAGVTQKGAVLIASPQGPPRTLLPEGSGVGHLMFSAEGRRLAIDRVGRGIQVLVVATGRARSVLPEPDPGKAPEVAGWSPDGRWILYWRGPVGKAGGTSGGVPSSGGAWVNLFDPVLPYRDFLSRCGNRIAVTAGGGQAVSVGKQIVLTGPVRFGTSVPHRLRSLCLTPRPGSGCQRASRIVLAGFEPCAGRRRA